MSTPRYLCSHLVRLLVDDREQWVNLEEIWGDGAELGCEEEVGRGALALILSEGLSFEGRVTEVEREETGWRVEVSFSPLTPWSIEQWLPEHALDPAKLGRP